MTIYSIITEALNGKYDASGRRYIGRIEAIENPYGYYLTSNLQLIRFDGEFDRGDRNFIRDNRGMIWNIDGTLTGRNEVIATIVREIKPSIYHQIVNRLTAAGISVSALPRLMHRHITSELMAA